MFNIAKNIIYYNYDSIKKYRGCFVNDIHYKIFVNSIVKKRKNIERIYLIITKKQIYSIYITLFSFRNFYILGFDKNRIFINKIDSDNGLNEIIEHYNINGIEIIIVNKREESGDFYFNLDYDFDIIDEWGDVDEVEVEKTGRYRIQGDLVINVRNYDDFERALNSTIVGEISNLIENIIANRILNILNSIGLSCEQRNRMVTISGIFRSVKLNDLAELKIIDVIENRLYVDDILSKLTNANITTIKRKSGDELYILIEDENNKKMAKGLFANNYYYNIATVFVITSYINNRIEVHCEVNRFILEIILNQYKNSIYYNIVNNYINNIQNIELNMGNHHIRIENTLANTFSIVINNVFNNNNFVLNMRLDRILVTPQTKIRIDHREHGTIYIKFKDTFSIEFGFTAIDAGFVERMNRYILKEMLKTKA